MNLVIYGAVGEKGGERALAHRLLEIAMEREHGMEQLPEVLRTEQGKPYFPAFPGIHFNLSHSRGAAVCALSDAPVGIDVEVLRTPPRRLAEGMEAEEFFRLWTAKEATLKWRGLGLSALRDQKPDRRCQCLEGFLPNCIVTVCPGVPVLAGQPERVLGGRPERVLGGRPERSLLLELDQAGHPVTLEVSCFRF